VRIAGYFRVVAELNPLEPITAVPLFTWTVGPLHLVLSNHAFMVLVVAGFLMVSLPLAVRSPKLVPQGLQNLVESVCVYVREEMARPLLGSQTDRYVGFLWTMFFFVLTLNLAGLVPTERIVTLITGRRSYVGGVATGNIFVTGALAAVAFVMTHAYGVCKHGVGGYLAHLAPPSPRWLLPLIYPLELLSLCIRPFTMAIRLFANIISGHMVIATILGLIFVFQHLGVAVVSVLASVALSFLELLVAFIQAYVFTFLCTLYIESSISTEH
jgi:F-type H+-transporting ATPase subunit a